MHLCQQNVSLDAWFATSKILHEKCDINSALNIVFQVLKDWKYGEKKLKHWIKSEKKIKSVEKIDNHIKEKKIFWKLWNRIYHDNFPWRPSSYTSF